MNLGLTFLGILLFITSLFMMALILVQRGKGGGLTGALGGMGGQSAFGSKAGDVFTKITVVTAIIWITLCMITIAAYNPPPRENLSRQDPPGIGGVDEDEEGEADKDAESAEMGEGSEADEASESDAADADPPENMDADVTELLPADEDAENADESDSNDDENDNSESTDEDGNDTESEDGN